MNKHFFLFTLYLLSLIRLANGQAITNPLSITITNKSQWAYTGKVVAVPWEQVIKKFPSVDTMALQIVDAGSKKEIEYQFEYAGNNTIQNLLLQISIKAGSSITLLMHKGTHGAFVTRTYGRFVPERKDDFAWENDKIAFRMYGKALESTPAENAYGMDVWVKRTGKMILNERYKRGEYHVDHGDGLDYYHVGLSLGAGNIAPYLNDSIWYSKNFTGYKVLDNGPLRTTFQLQYEGWNVAGKTVTATKTISLDAGTQLNRISVEYRYEGADNLPVVAGIIKRPEAGTVWLHEQQGIAAYWEPPHGADGITGVGIIIPSAVKQMQVTGKQILAVSESKKGVPFVYYTGAAWNKAGIITNHRQWFDYLQQAQQQIADDGISVLF